MSGIRGYFLGIVSVSMIAGIITALQSGKTGVSKLVKLIAGLVLSLYVITPVETLSTGDLLEQWDIELGQGSDAVEYGQSIAAQEKAKIISDQTAAYILDKANGMGLEVRVDVILEGDDWPMPIAVTLSGRASPYHRKALEEMLVRDLEIPRENILWTE